MTNKTIWILIKEHGFDDATEIFKDIPTKFYPIVYKLMNFFKNERDIIFNKCLNLYKRILWELINMEDFNIEEDYLKDFTLRVKKSAPEEYHTILFAFHEKKDYEKLLIDMIEPLEVKSLW